MVSGWRKGFTLIELLVVISIIALLMSIIMPCLSKVKDKARDVSCLNNERQFGLAAGMLAQENNYKMEAEYEQAQWVEDLRPYLGMNKEAGSGDKGKSKEDVGFCPVADKARYDIDGNIGPGSGKGPFSAWGIYTDGYQQGIAGSYGINAWVYNVSIREQDGRHRLNKQWGSFNVSNAAQIPFILDSYTYSVYAEADDKPPEFEVGAEYLQSGISRFCVNRHSGNVNGVFLDFSVRKVGLKELWTLPWHREYKDDWQMLITRAKPFEWPVWMRNMKDYF
ncbi:MAG: type II secretion system protein [Planctomycetota bacterium]|jgi:prepilin-type N-terminal cleavage/methylation domain-containing protein/prepilin-type processing-associated H-X9-DG protein